MNFPAAPAVHEVSVCDLYVDRDKLRQKDGHSFVMQAVQKGKGSIVSLFAAWGTPGDVLDMFSDRLTPAPDASTTDEITTCLGTGYFYLGPENVLHIGGLAKTGTDLPHDVLSQGARKLLQRLEAIGISLSGVRLES